MNLVATDRAAGPEVMGHRPALALPPLYAAAAVLPLVAAVVHLWISPGHLIESPPYGAFFLALALIQGLYGVALLRWPSRRLLAVGAWGSLALVALHAAERAAGASFGPHAEQAGGFEVFAMLCAAAELGLLSALVLDERGALAAAETLSFGAALVHLWAAQGRDAGWWGFVAFFVAVGAAQALYSIALPRFGRRAGFLLLGVAGNLSVLAVWVMTRTVGVPYVRTTGIETSELRLGGTEGVGVADLAATTMEVALVAMLAMLAVNLYRRRLTDNP
jgi:hypothetical protein